jgi:hypothetical protein
MRHDPKTHGSVRGVAYGKRPEHAGARVDHSPKDGRAASPNAPGRRHRRPRKILFPHVERAGQDDGGLKEGKAATRTERTKGEEALQRRAHPDGGEGSRRQAQLEGGEKRRKESDRWVAELAGPDMSTLLHETPASGRESDLDGTGAGEGTGAGAGAGEGTGSRARCLHGYASAAKLGSCVCSHGWGGASCEVDKIPSCNRSETYTCHNVVLGKVLARPSCSCYAECRAVLTTHHGDDGFQ